MSGRLTLEKGKFWMNGQVVPIEFGNKEQIELMNRKLEEIYALEHEGLPIEDSVECETRVVASLSFKCPCGHRIDFEELESDEFEPNFDFRGQKNAVTKLLN